MDAFVFPNWNDDDHWDDDATWAEDATSLLPANNSGPAELAIEQTGARIEDFPDLIRPLYSPANCPADLLPWLAWALSVDVWDASWSEEVRREVVRQSVSVHKRKGTIASIRRALIAAGLGDATLIENFGDKFYDGTASHNAEQDHSSPDHWAEYRVILSRPMTNAQADTVRRVLADVAPLRCHLKFLDFREVAFVHNSALTYNGAANYGAA